MPETEKTTYQHLVDLPDRHRDEVQSKMESVSQFEDSENLDGLKPLWDVTQPMADRIIHDIAKFSEQAYQNLQKGINTDGSDKKLTHNEVWQEAIKIYFTYLFDLKDRLDTGYSDDLKSEYLASVESILVMYSLDIVNSNQDRNHKNINALKLLELTGHQEIAVEAIDKIESSGLAIRDVNGNFVPITSMLIEVDSEKQQKMFLDHAFEGIKRLENGIEKNGLFRELDASLEYSDLKRSIMAIDWLTAPYESINNIIAQLIELDNKINNLNKVQKVDFIDNGIFITNELLNDESFSNLGLARLYFGEAGSDISNLKKLLEEGEIVNANDLIAYEQLLNKIYSPVGGMKSVGKYQDVAVDRVAYPEKGYDYCTAILERLAKQEHDGSKKSIENYNKEVNKVMVAFYDIMGFSDSLRDIIFKSSYARIHRDAQKQKIDKEYDIDSIKKFLLKIDENVSILGLETIEKLHNKLGFVNLDYYNDTNLRQAGIILEAYEKNPDADYDFIEKLKNRDVTVVMVDAYNDHNSAFSNMNKKFDSYNDSTLFFEVGKSASDFYRIMIMLNKLGIKPSTVVLAAHGQPGSIDFGITQLSSNRFVPKSKIKSKIIAIDETSAKRLVSEYMQPSREIDGPYEGKMRIIIDSCSGDANFAEGIYSTAESLTRTIGNQNLEIYASSVVSFSRRSGGEVTFYDYDTREKDNEEGSSPQSSTVKLSVDFSGDSENDLAVIRKKVDGIRMSMEGNIYYAK